MKINGKQWTIIGLVIVAVWGGAMAISKAVGCIPCVEVLSGFQDSLPQGEAVSGTTVVADPSATVTP